MTNLTFAFTNEWRRVAYFVQHEVGTPSEPPQRFKPFKTFWEREGSAGSAALVHSEIITTGATYSTDPAVIKLAQSLAPAGHTVKVLCGGSTEWIACANGWYRSLVHLGSGWCALSFCSLNYIRISFEDGITYYFNRYGYRWIKEGYGGSEDIASNNDVLDDPPIFWFSKYFKGIKAGRFGYASDPSFCEQDRPIPPDPEFTFKDAELETYYGVKDLGICMDAVHARAFASAYTDAASRLPEASCNMIANILECVTFIRDFFKGRGLKIPKTAGDAWLTYRYVLKTTELDLSELANVSARLGALALNGQTMTTYGSYRYGDVEYRCGIKLAVQDILPHGLAQTLDQQFGLRLSLTNVWDMIPYSFIVDWFLGIGGMLEAFEAHRDALELKPLEVWYSMTTRYFIDGGYQTTYVRLQGANAAPSALPFYTRSRASAKTLLMRITDTFALFLS